MMLANQQSYLLGVSSDSDDCSTLSSSKTVSSVALGGMNDVLLVVDVVGACVEVVVNLLNGLLLFVPNNLLLASSVVDSSVDVVVVVVGIGDVFVVA